MYKQNTGRRTMVLGCSLFFLLQCCIGIVPIFASTKTLAIETNNINAAKSENKNAQQIVNQRKQCFDNSWRFKLADPRLRVQCQICCAFDLKIQQQHYKDSSRY